MSHLQDHPCFGMSQARPDKSHDEDEMAFYVCQQSNTLSQVPTRYCHSSVCSTGLMTPNVYPDSDGLLEGLQNRDRHLMAEPGDACAI